MKQPAKPDEKAALVKALRRIADELGTRSVSQAEFVRRGGIAKHKILHLFGSYNGFVEAAGLVPRSFLHAPTYSDDEMIAEIVRVLRIPNSQLTTIFFEQHSQISPSSCQRRLGGWMKALKAAGDKLDPERESDLLTRIRAYTAPKVQASRAAAAPAAGGRQSLRQSTDGEDLALPASESGVHRLHGNVYGDFIHLRGLEHAPVNEQGVVFLFAMICRELGYVVEMVKLGFPDCEAKRQVRPGIWQRVRIEFEFRSRTFRTHGHDPEQCDLIVCWENNWPTCPIEVLELKSASQRLALSSRGSNGNP